MKRTSFFSLSVSPTRSVPWLGMPMMSPASAVSAISRSCAKNRIGECTAIGLPRPDGVSFMPRLKVPETIRMKAIRSRCCGSMLAWTLKMKPVTSSRLGSIVPCLARLRARRRGEAGDRLDQFGHAEVLERRCRR